MRESRRVQVLPRLEPVANGRLSFAPHVSNSAPAAAPWPPPSPSIPNCELVHTHLPSSGTENTGRGGASYDPTCEANAPVAKHRPACDRRIAGNYLDLDLDWSPATKPEPAERQHAIRRHGMRSRSSVFCDVCTSSQGLAVILDSLPFRNCLIAEVLRGRARFMNER